jgi:hypothetical protein
MPRRDPFGSVDKDGGIELYLPVIPRSGNTYLRLHGVARWREKRALGWLVVAAGSRIKKHQRKARARLLCIVVSTSKARDFDNLVAGLKPIVDCVVQDGWLVDDSPTWVDWQMPQQLRPSGALKPGMYIRIEYLPTEVNHGN